MVEEEKSKINYVLVKKIIWLLKNNLVKKF
jgi:hypothetical protein